MICIATAYKHSSKNSNKLTLNNLEYKIGEIKTTDFESIYVLPGHCISYKKH